MKQLFAQQRRSIWVAAVVLLGAVACTKTEEAEFLAAQPETQTQCIILTPTRSYDEALALAQQSIGIVDRAKTRALHPRVIRSTRGQCVTAPGTRNGESQLDTLMYVFNFEDNNGFSIIAANRAVDPVLAVVEKGNYTYGEKTGVENFDFYMDALALELQDRVKPPIFDTLNPLPIFKTVEVDEEKHCDPLVPVQWGQEGVFGAYGKNGIAGCVATAMAQIMAYYRYPTSITTTYPNDGFTEHYKETIALDWESMIAYSSGYQISALLREIGQKVGMNYNDSTCSRAQSSAVFNGFKAFGYSCPSSYSAFNYTSIRSSLNNKQPVYISGIDAEDSTSGHAWVADGYIYTRKGTEYYDLKLIDDGLVKPYYDYVLVSSTVVTTNLVHYNWGWDGLYDGYFTAGSTVEAGYKFVNLKTLVPTL